MLPQRHLFASALLASTYLHSASADVSFSSPSAGQVISGSTINVEFAEGSDDPPLADFTTYTLQLCAGGNDATDFTPILTFTSAGDFSKDTYTAKITDLTVGGNTKNAYFLRTMGVAPGGTVINYSSRFTLSGMTGTFSSAVQAGLADVSGTAGPKTDNQVANPQNAAPAGSVAVDAGQFSVPYTMQTGAIRYAPMAVKAPSQITAKGNARQYPTSAWNIWSRKGMPAPDATQTVTNPFTYSVQSMEPTIAAAAQPDDMQKFLNRWKD
ncbi:Cell wall synthesis protein kre9 precursor [Exophiala xenobiotica]|uniref:Cell wall synthesis protein kre9 n=1 Tax=Lithohypha guttulata TaxID=1690604 RepID=A0ABR0KAQ9_9EURO|nr:Cell wall synthesis protein kre9 precursor [Lithohypha guttulata]KAK5326919.1 Cell wall synthesis protein kre9 precursor [Exophiala xenobiotica]